MIALLRKNQRQELNSGTVFLDGATIHAHHKAVEAAIKGNTGDATGIFKRLSLAWKL